MLTQEQNPLLGRPNERALGKDQWLVLLAAFLGWMFDGVEMGLFPLAAPPALRELLRTSDRARISSWNGAFAAMFLLGATAGGLLFGWLGDRLGRVRSMAISIAAYSVFTSAYFLRALAARASCQRLFRGFQSYSASFLVMSGIMGVWVVSFFGLVPSYLPELYPTRVRATGQGVAFNFGRVLAAVGAVSSGQLVAHFRGDYAAACATITLISVVPSLRPEGGRQPHRRPCVGGGMTGKLTPAVASE